MVTALVFLIEIYQKTVSPDHGIFKSRYPYGFCRHYPSCSEYAKHSFLKHGFFKGLYLTSARIVRCNPWTDCSFDPVP